MAFVGIPINGPTIQLPCAINRIELHHRHVVFKWGNTRDGYIVDPHKIDPTRQYAEPDPHPCSYYYPHMFYDLASGLLSMEIFTILDPITAINLKLVTAEQLGVPEAICALFKLVEP